MPTSQRSIARAIAAVLAVGCQLYVGLHMALVAWLMAAWPLNDSRAFALDDDGWVRAGIGRAVFFACGAVIVGVGCWLWGRFVVRRLWPGMRGQTWIPVTIAVVVAVAGLLGAIRFIEERPYV